MFPGWCPAFFEVCSAAPREQRAHHTRALFSCFSFWDPSPSFFFLLWKGFIRGESFLVDGRDAGHDPFHWGCRERENFFFFYWMKEKWNDSKKWKGWRMNRVQSTWRMNETEVVDFFLTAGCSGEMKTQLGGLFSPQPSLIFGPPGLSRKKIRNTVILKHLLTPS